MLYRCRVTDCEAGTRTLPREITRSRRPQRARSSRLKRVVLTADRPGASPRIIGAMFKCAPPRAMTAHATGRSGARLINPPPILPCGVSQPNRARSRADCDRGGIKCDLSTFSRARCSLRSRQRRDCHGSIRRQTFPNRTSRGYSRSYGGSILWSWIACPN
jgi:hypothetical protein